MCHLNRRPIGRSIAYLARYACTTTSAACTRHCALLQLWNPGLRITFGQLRNWSDCSSFGRGHLDHHMHVGTPGEPEHVSLGRRPFHIALLFASNGIVVIALDLLLGFRVAPGIFVGWTVYLVAAEEIHWRIHMDGWLPPGLRFARAYHMSHHEIPNTRYNVFLPFCDFLFGNTAFAINVTATENRVTTDMGKT